MKQILIAIFIIAIGITSISKASTVYLNTEKCHVVYTSGNISTFESDIPGDFKQFYRDHSSSIKVGICKPGKDLTKEEIAKYSKYGLSFNKKFYSVKIPFYKYK